MPTGLFSTLTHTPIAHIRCICHVQARTYYSKIKVKENSQGFLRDQNPPHISRHFGDSKHLYVEKGRRRRKEGDGKQCKWPYRMCAMCHVHCKRASFENLLRPLLFSLLHVHYQLENHSRIIFLLLKTVENSHRANISILCPNLKREIVSTNVLNYKLRDV